MISKSLSLDYLSDPAFSPGNKISFSGLLLLALRFSVEFIIIKNIDNVTLLPNKIYYINQSSYLRHKTLRKRKKYMLSYAFSLYMHKII